jgi:cellulose synthase/poly-beta-1,6-N-acetylglucosamine synthase-like glycosyltransferase
MGVPEIAFWTAISVVIYVYAGYPVLLVGLSAVFRRPPQKRPIEPSVSLVVAAYNEADVIEAKVRNALDLDYPADRLQIAIASDGSKDGTAELARAAAGGDPRVRVFDYPMNRGKIIALNDTVPHLTGEILAFSDASSMLAADSMRQLVMHFADPTVGAVSGVYKVRGKEQAELGVQEGFYWKYETFLKVQEAKLGSILGAHGSLYAIRRSLYPFPPAGTINDDAVIPIRILQQGYRVSYEPKAVAYEEAQEMSGFSRRVRIMAGNLQQLNHVREFLWPPQPLSLFFYLSHKVGRLAAAVALPLAFGFNLLLLDHPFYRALAALQVVFYAIAGAGALRTLRPRILGLPYYFCMINLAMFLALYRSLLPRRQIAWKQ